MAKLLSNSTAEWLKALKGRGADLRSRPDPHGPPPDTPDGPFPFELRLNAGALEYWADGYAVIAMPRTAYDGGATISPDATVVPAVGGTLPGWVSLGAVPASGQRSARLIVYGAANSDGFHPALHWRVMTDEDFPYVAPGSADRMELVEIGGTSDGVLSQRVFGVHVHVSDYGIFEVLKNYLSDNYEAKQ